MLHPTIIEINVHSSCIVDDESNDATPGKIEELRNVVSYHTCRSSATEWAYAIIAAVCMLYMLSLINSLDDYPMHTSHN